MVEEAAEVKVLFLGSWEAEKGNRQGRRREEPDQGPGDVPPGHPQECASLGEQLGDWMQTNHADILS